MTSANKSLLHSLFTALAAGNSRPFVDAPAEDFRWVIAGRTARSRTFEGKQAVYNALHVDWLARAAGRRRFETRGPETRGPATREPEY